MKIGLLLIATKKYKQFVQPLLEDVKKYFLPKHQIDVYLYTDDVECPAIGDERVTIIKDLITSWGFPQATLYRYKIFTYKNDVEKQYPGADYLFYMDVDMAIKEEIREEILAPIIAVRHPGFFKGGGSWGDNRASLSYTYDALRKKYYAGGFQGGEAAIYYGAAQQMSMSIDYDEKRGIMAEWHDETHWNKYLSERIVFKELPPSYCMVEQEHLRREWGINHFPAKIVALAKNHEEIRS